MGDTESAVNDRIVIPLIEACNNENGKIMEGSSIEARVKHGLEDSIIKVEAHAIIKGKDGKKRRQNMNMKNKDNSEIIH